MIYRTPKWETEDVWASHSDARVCEESEERRREADLDEAWIDAEQWIEEAQNGE